MKTQLTPVLMLTLALQALPAVANTQAATPIEADTQLQISVDDTLARIQAVLAQMQQAVPGNASLYGQDFLSAHAALMSRMQPALLNVQNAVQQVQSSLQVHLNRFHGASTSTDLTDRQKRELLELIKADMLQMVPALTAVYQNSISSTYDQVLSLPYVSKAMNQVDLSRRQKRTLRCSRSTDVYRTWTFQTADTLRTLEVSECLQKSPGISKHQPTLATSQKIKDQWVLPTVLAGCESRSCMSLMRDAALRFLEQMDSQINRALEITIGQPGQIASDFRITLSASPIHGSSQYKYLLATPWQSNASIPYIVR